MNPITREAVEWLLNQPEFYLQKNPAFCRVIILGDHGFDASHTNTEDAICAAYEELHLKPARAQIRAEDRTTLPDYTD